MTTIGVRQWSSTFRHRRVVGRSDALPVLLVHSHLMAQRRAPA